jgi:hypothetical protein
MRLFIVLAKDKVIGRLKSPLARIVPHTFVSEEIEAYESCWIIEKGANGS